MRALLAVLLVAGATSVLAGRRPDAGRSLLQSSCTEPAGCTACPNGCDMTSPSNCIGSTPGFYKCVKCIAYSATDLPTSTQSAAWVNRVPSRLDGSCGCAPKYYMKTVKLNNKDFTICEICPKDSYCPGGTETFQTKNSGNDAKVACPDNMATTNTGRSSVLDCVNKAGYSYVPPADGSTNAPSAAICDGNTFSVGLRRQKTCTPCPGGLRLSKGLDNDVAFPQSAGTLTIPTTVGSTAISPAYKKDYGNDGNPDKGATSASLCLVPPGFYAVSRSKVIRCPKGEFRQDYVSQGVSTSKCSACPRGTTTFGSGSPSVDYCDQLLPGFYWTAPDTRSKNAQSTDTVTKICDQKCYCPGGYAQEKAASPSGRTACPKGMWTRATGAKASSDCMVPPGHRLDKSDTDATKHSVTPCVSGEYFPDWRAEGATDVEKCQKCGTDIASEAVEVLPTFDVNADFTVTQKTTRVARTSASCYIEAGDGIVMENGKFRKVVCNTRNYGVAARQYELRVTPCRECPPGTVTESISSLDSGGFCTAQARKYQRQVSTTTGGTTTTTY
uniref:Tyrosine-protein kinase ephrin type A/B receptor-like domain-containing protein n=1 Tax=Tetradesmus obliquus TaxID=3088 RepID=A0A383VC64_TETOB|eukprot:jgi/Sobl393_1/7137/SZX63167.1